MRNREEFVLEAVVPGADISALCPKYGMNWNPQSSISRSSEDGFSAGRAFGADPAPRP